MSTLWTARDAAAATGGQALGDWAARGLSIDTRTLEPGDLFVALKAARDGHDFVAEALAKGAAAALVSHPPQGLAADAPLLLVPDVQTALEDLGRAGRARMAGRVIAVTGSAGKTTTKDMLRVMLTPQGRTHASLASYNNHWGVPLTLARMPAGTDFAVIEIGMNAPGEIAPLSRMARPHVAMVTTVAAAHLEAFGVLDGIAHEKASIFEGLEAGGLALANLDVSTAPILRAAAEAAARATNGRWMGFGQTPDAPAHLAQVTLGDSATVIRATLSGAPLLYKLAVPGRHLALNSLAALAAVEAVGGDVTRAMIDLAAWQPVSGRGTRERLVLNRTDDHAIELIDDAYNANPASVAAALEVLAAATPEGRGRRIAVLGDMLELGPTGPALHAALADDPSMAKVDLVFTCGALMAHLQDALPVGKRGAHVEDAARMAQILPDRLRAGDVLLVKGSNSSKLARVVDALRKLGQAIAD